MDQGPQRGPYIRQPSILRSSLYPGSALASFARFEKKRVTSPQTHIFFFPLHVPLSSREYVRGNESFERGLLRKEVFSKLKG